MQNPPPIPQPSSYTCPNCGAGWNEPRAFCPNCGYNMNQQPQVLAPVSGCVIALYVLGMLIFGGIGACFSLIGVADRGLNGMLIIGVPCLALAAFFLYKLVRGGR